MAGNLCPYCNKPIEPDELKVQDGDDWYHIGCAAEEQDGNDLTNELSGGD